VWQLDFFAYTLAGSGTAAGLRHGASARLNAPSKPLARNVSTSVTPPA